MSVSSPTGQPQDAGDPGAAGAPLRQTKGVPYGSDSGDARCRGQDGSGALVVRAIMIRDS
eukprot:5855345-Pyramimonas_sp.AAC.1